MQTLYSNQNRLATEHPGVIAKPPTIFLGIIALAYFANYLAPIEFGSFAYHQLVGALLVAGGLTVVTIAMRQFKANQTPIEVWKESQTLVTSGIYRFSRNPIYVGMFEIYLGIYFFGLNGWLLVLLGPLTAIMTFGVVLREEAYLITKFDSLYQQYLMRTRRWI